MAKVLIEGESLGVDEREYTNRETGEVRRWHQLKVLTEGDEVLELNVETDQLAELYKLERLAGVTVQAEVYARRTREGAVLSWRLLSWSPVGASRAA